MVRLFAAIELPDTVRAELADRLRALRAADPGLDQELTWAPPERWHLTLGFYGDREHVDRRATWFRHQAAGLAGTRLRLRGAGRFPGVLWAGINPMTDADTLALRTLATALRADANADELDFVPHVTLARWRRGASASERAIGAVHELADFLGTWWTVTHVVLFRSDHAHSGPVYTALTRVPLARTQG